VNRPEITLRNQIGLSWVIPEFEGGSLVIDYAVWYDNALGGELMQLEDSIVDQTYTAINLVQGSTYRFRVKARNIYGYSWFSNEHSELAA
jgi:hypothetical protein